MPRSSIPAWHDIDDESHSVPVRDGNARPTDHDTHHRLPARRMPAAIIGILLVTAIGMTMVHDTAFWTGQSALTTTQPDIVLHDEGIVPASLIVHAGQSVIVRNSSSIPQILFFETLIGPNGQPVESAIIHQETDVSIIIPATIPAGTYPYASSTARDLAGMLIVRSPDSLVPDDITTAESEAFASSPTVAAPAEAPVAPIAPPAQIMQPQLPVNPYAVGTEHQPVISSQHAGAQLQDVMRHTPETTADTGTGAWLTVIIGAFAFVFVLRKAEA